MCSTLHTLVDGEATSRRCQTSEPVDAETRNLVQQRWEDRKPSAEKKNRALSVQASKCPQTIVPAYAGA